MHGLNDIDFYKPLNMIVTSTPRINKILGKLMSKTESKSAITTNTFLFGEKQISLHMCNCDFVTFRITYSLLCMRAIGVLLKNNQLKHYFLFLNVDGFYKEKSSAFFQYFIPLTNSFSLDMKDTTITPISFL